MGRLIRTTKQGWERYFIYGDFSEVMEDGETISSQSFSAIDKDKEDATDEILIVDDAYDDGHKQYVRIADGSEDKSPYKVTIRIETSNGNRWETEGEVVVKEQ